MKLSFLARHRSSSAVSAVWPARALGMLAWAVAGYTAVFWALQWGASPHAEGLTPVPAVLPDVDSGAVARALGGGAAPVQAVVSAVAQPGLAQRLSLQGVLTRAEPAREAGQGVALLSIDGQKARPYAQGAVVDGQWTVRRVEARAVVLAPKVESSERGGADVRLEMPSQVSAQNFQKK